MVKKYRFEGKLTAGLIDDLTKAGLSVVLHADLSRNSHMTLDHCGRDIAPSAAPHGVLIVLHIEAGDCTAERYVALKSGFLNRKLAALMRVLDRAGGLPALAGSKVVIEAPHFDTAIIDMRDPPLDLTNAHMAAVAPDADAFMALPSQVRSALGVYRRDAPQMFTRLGAPLDPAPVAKISRV